jgi:ADP-ribose pyrophosphatase YjhB (NUDIX family)
VTALPGKVTRGAGGIVLRENDGVVEIVIIHRPTYDDWSLPKGKLQSGETYEDGAIREVEEEIGVLCSILGPGGSTHYIDHRGRDKVVRYFAMAADTKAKRLAAFDPTEVDEAVWVPLDVAANRLSHEHDQALIRQFISEDRAEELEGWRPSAETRNVG